MQSSHLLNKIQDVIIQIQPGVTNEGSRVSVVKSNLEFQIVF
jgi:hypothetical protein